MTRTLVAVCVALLVSVGCDEVGSPPAGGDAPGKGAANPGDDAGAASGDAGGGGDGGAQIGGAHDGGVTNDGGPRDGGPRDGGPRDGDVPSIPSDITIGSEETVFDWTTDKCTDDDVPDVNVHAFRTAQNKIVLMSGNAPTFRSMFGPDFNSLRRGCTPQLVSDALFTASSFDNYQWLSSVYTLDGLNIFAVIHNEFHDPNANNCSPGNPSPSNLCSYYSLDTARSSDSGRTFTHGAAPGSFLATTPYQWDANALGGAAPLLGYMNPGNIVHAPDGYYYMPYYAIPMAAHPEVNGTCMMRTPDVTDPTQWRIWNGTDFSLQPKDPYTVTVDPGHDTCTFIPSLWGLHESLTFNTYLGAYLMVGASQFYLPLGATTTTCGFFYSLSYDLLHWTTPVLLRQADQPYCNAHLSHTDVYPSIINHADTTRNFEVSGQTPYLYFTRWNNGLDRDLLRQRITFTH